MELPRYPLLALLFLFPACQTMGMQPETNVIPASAGLERLQPHQRVAAQRENVRTVVTNNELKNNPQMAGALLNQAVEDEQWSIVKELLPIYQASPQADLSLLRYAQAGLARSEGNYTQAIALYRTLLSEHPDFVRVRLDLARALFEDRQYEAATYHFEKARAENPPPEVQENIEKYLAYMADRGGWSGNFSLSYLNDSNINNASNDQYIHIGDKVFERNENSYPKRGEGFYFGGTAQRDVNITDHNNLRFKATVSGKSYWNNHDYDDITSRIYLGYAYQDYKQQLALLPFYEKRWFGTDAYSSGAGVRAEYSYLLAPDWQSSNAIEYQKLNYDKEDYRYLRGYNTLFSTTLSHAINSRVSVFVGADLAEQNTENRAETNQRLAGRFGVETALPYGISLGAMVGLAQRKYQAESDIFQTKRKDDEEIYALSLWHRDFYFFNLMPKINFVYKKVSSNIDFYSYDQRNIFLSVDRKF